GGQPLAERRAEAGQILEATARAALGGVLGERRPDAGDRAEQAGAQPLVRAALDPGCDPGRLRNRRGIEVPEAVRADQVRALEGRVVTARENRQVTRCEQCGAQLALEQAAEPLGLVGAPRQAGVSRARLKAGEGGGEPWPVDREAARL